MSDLTQILARVEQGDGEAAAQLLPLVYEELRSLAAARMAQEPPGHRLLLARETMPCCRASTSPVGRMALRLVFTPFSSVTEPRAHACLDGP